MKNKTTYDRAMHDKTHPYTCISAELINNENLTGEERFLIVYLLGRSDDYIFNSSHFADNAQKLFGWGRDKFYKVWKSLKDKGFIEKVTFRDKGMIGGQHYTIHEILPDLLKNQNTENPESGKSGIRETNTLPSIDKLNIDKPNIDKPKGTKTNLAGENASQGEEKKLTRNRVYDVNKNREVNELFDHICSLNPLEHSSNWKMNDTDLRLLKKVIDILGIDKAKAFAEYAVNNSNNEYCSIAYIFADFKKRGSNTAWFLKHPKFIDGLISNILSEDIVEKVMGKASELKLYFFIRETASFLHKAADKWDPSEKDLEACHCIVVNGDRINLAEKLQDGMKSALVSGKWSFNQIVYQAMAALNTYDEHYTL